MITLPTISQLQPNQANSKSLHLKQWLTISVLALLLAVLTSSSHRYWQTARTVSLPNLQGAAATEYIKQQNLYDSLSAALTAARYQVHPISKRTGEFAAQNPAQHLHAVFTAAGLELTSTNQKQTQRLRMRLRGAGYGGRLLAASADTVNAQEERVEIRHTLSSGNSISSQNLPFKITEWYVNRPSGLEQGFTLDQPLGMRREGERLRLALDISGEFRAKASTDGQAVEFSDKAGQQILRYDHLQVTDARGQQIVARLAMAGQELQLEVEDQEAQYPLTIDPTFSQLAYLKASNTSNLDEFGHSVAISGDTIVVGAPHENSDSSGVNGDQNNFKTVSFGAAYVFIRNGASLSQQAYLKASNTGTSDNFGTAVAISDDTIVIGAHQEDSNATGVNGDQVNDNASNSGAAYVFTRSGTTWSQQAYLKASNTQAGDQFGWSVGVSGNTIVVGSPLEDSIAKGINGDQNNNSSVGAGAVYVYTHTNTAPTITAQTGITQQQGSPVRNIQIATVNDDANNLSVTVNGGNSATINGVTVSNIRFSAAGNITADVIASCSATTASFTLRATDSGGLFDEAALNVAVTLNTPTSAFLWQKAKRCSERYADRESDYRDER